MKYPRLIIFAVISVFFAFSCSDKNEDDTENQLTFITQIDGFEPTSPSGSDWVDLSGSAGMDLYNYGKFNIDSPKVRVPSGATVDGDGHKSNKLAYETEHKIIMDYSDNATTLISDKTQLYFSTKSFQILAYDDGNASRAFAIGMPNHTVINMACTGNGNITLLFVSGDQVTLRGYRAYQFVFNTTENTMTVSGGDLSGIGDDGWFCDPFCDQ